jgi:hypothetical protein
MGHSYISVRNPEMNIPFWNLVWDDNVARISDKNEQPTIPW